MLERIFGRRMTAAEHAVADGEARAKALDEAAQRYFGLWAYTNDNAAKASYREMQHECERRAAEERKRIFGIQFGAERSGGDA